MDQTQTQTDNLLIAAYRRYQSLENIHFTIIQRSGQRRIDKLWCPSFRSVNQPDSSLIAPFKKSGQLPRHSQPRKSKPGHFCSMHSPFGSPTHFSQLFCANATFHQEAQFFNHIGTTVRGNFHTQKTHSPSLPKSNSSGRRFALLMSASEFFTVFSRKFSLGKIPLLSITHKRDGSKKLFTRTKLFLRFALCTESSVRFEEPAWIATTHQDTRAEKRVKF